MVRALRARSGPSDGAADVESSIEVSTTSRNPVDHRPLRRRGRPPSLSSVTVNLPVVTAIGGKQLIFGLLYFVNGVAVGEQVNVWDYYSQIGNLISSILWLLLFPFWCVWRFCDTYFFTFYAVYVVINVPSLARAVIQISPPPLFV